jgi:hypothetical protein
MDAYKKKRDAGKRADVVGVDFREVFLKALSFV